MASTTEATGTKLARFVLPGAGDGGTDAYRDVEVDPGMTVSQALDKVGLSGGYRLAKAGRGMPFLGPDEDLHELIKDPGEKFIATPIPEQGR